MLATGGSAIMAIDVLKDAGVKAPNILFLNLVSCPEGIQVRISCNFQMVPQIQRHSKHRAFHRQWRMRTQKSKL